MRRVLCGIAIVLAAALSGGCANTHQQSPICPHLSERAQFGFDPVSEIPEWRVGDSVVFEFRIFDGTEEYRFYVVCEVAPQPDDEGWPADLPRSGSYTVNLRLPSGEVHREETRIPMTWDSIYVTLERHDADFRVLGSTDFVLPMHLFEKGSYDPLRVLQSADLDEGASISDTRRLELAENAGVIPMTLLVYERMLSRPGIRDLAGLVVRKSVDPDLLLLLMATGYSFHTVLPDMIVEPSTEALPLPRGFKTPCSYEATCQLQTPFGEKPICTLKITTVPPLPPFHVSGGVVLVEGAPIRESNRWFQIRLVSAKRGLGPVVRRR